MTLEEYFKNTEGTGVLSTADGEGKVDSAIYARPRVIDDHTIAFIMADRLSHGNLQANPQAAYLFIEKNSSYQGKRLYLTRQKEVTDRAIIEEEMRKRNPRSVERYGDAKKFFVYFTVNDCLPLVGDHKEEECV
jgi:hypothetical protein